MVAEGRQFGRGFVEREHHLQGDRRGYVVAYRAGRVGIQGNQRRSVAVDEQRLPFLDVGAPVAHRVPSGEHGVGGAAWRGIGDLEGAGVGRSSRSTEGNGQRHTALRHDAQKRRGQHGFGHGQGDVHPSRRDAAGGGIHVALRCIGNADRAGRRGVGHNGDRVGGFAAGTEAVAGHHPVGVVTLHRRQVIEVRGGNRVRRQPLGGGHIVKRCTGAVHQVAGQVPCRDRVPTQRDGSRLAGPSEQAGGRIRCAAVPGNDDDVAGRAFPATIGCPRGDGIGALQELDDRGEPSILGDRDRPGDPFAIAVQPNVAAGLGLSLHRLHRTVGHPACHREGDRGGDGCGEVDKDLSTQRADVVQGVVGGHREPLFAVGNPGQVQHGGVTIVAGTVGGLLPVTDGEHHAGDPGRIGGADFEQARALQGRAVAEHLPIEVQRPEHRPLIVLGGHGGNGVHLRDLAAGQVHAGDREVVRGAVVQRCHAPGGGGGGNHQCRFAAGHRRERLVIHVDALLGDYRGRSRGRPAQFNLSREGLGGKIVRVGNQCRHLQCGTGGFVAGFVHCVDAERVRGGG